MSDIWRPARKSSKSGLDRICSKLRAEVASLRAAVKALQTAPPRKSATIVADGTVERDAAKQKRIAERESARRAHAEFLAKQAAAKPEKDKARSEWEAKEKVRRREANRICVQKWRAANPEKNRASEIRSNERRRSAAAKRLAERDLPDFSAADKIKDSRYRWFTENHGHRCVELDAMPPPELRARVRAAILAHIDGDIWEESLARFTQESHIANV